MKYLGKIQDDKDLVTKEFVEELIPETVEADYIEIDTTVTEDSTNLITSGAVYDAIPDVSTKADLVNGKVPTDQLPEMDYIPTSAKGAASGVASLDANTHVPSAQISGLGYLTTAPTADNTDGVKLVVLSSEPATKYAGYIYFITEA